MSEDIQQPGSSPFDAIMHRRPDGEPYWSARELMPYLGYVNWQKMESALDRARRSCQNSGYEPADHFTGAGKSVQFGARWESCGGRRADSARLLSAGDEL